MKPLRKFLDGIEPYFSKGGPYERFQAMFEMVDTLFYTPATVTRGAPHVRDSLDLKRVMILVLLASFPAMLIGVWNTGYQANLGLASLGLEQGVGWRSAVLVFTGIGFDPGNAMACFTHGLLYFLPIYIVTMTAGGLWEVLFAGVRNHEVNEGFLVTGWLFALILPASTPLWQVAVGISFGVVLGKEVFGGTGKNFLNPALAGRAFLYFAYPVEMSGDQVWIPVDGFSGATPLGIGAIEGMTGVLGAGVTWMDAFLGNVPGSIGETSAIACLLGGAFLMFTGIASWRIVAGVFLGMVASALLFNFIGSDSNPMLAMP
jgi:Na+-transporting NADH:ubiquinone oxidoreductase subunit B